MTTKKFQALNDTFEIESEVVSTEIEKVEPKSIVKGSSDITVDYEYSRATLMSLVEKGQEAINSVLELAQETDSARSFEVVGQLIKTVADATEKLMENQKKLRDLEEEKTSGNVTNNALFVGTTSEVLNLLKNELKIKPNKTINNKKNKDQQ
jgi:hydrogenase maturation factor HypF (carbamoyltransferase family)